MDSYSIQAAPSPILDLFWGILVIFGWGVLAIGIVVAMMYCIRYFFLKYYRSHLSSEKVVLQVMVPKEGSTQKDDDTKPKDLKETIAVAESLFSGLGSIRPRGKIRTFFMGRDDELSLEIVMIEGLIRFYMVIPQHLQAFIEQQVLAQYPYATVEEVADYNIFRPKGAIAAASLVPNKHWIFPFRSFRKMDTDPLNSITNALSKLEKTQGGAIQIVIRTARGTWRRKGQKIARAMQQGKSLDKALATAGGWQYAQKASGIIGGVVTGAVDAARTTKKDEAGKPSQTEYRLSPLEQELIKSIEEKGSKPGFETCIRIVTSADFPSSADMQLYNITNAFAQYLGPESGITFTQAKFISKARLVSDFIYRFFDARRGFILNAEELASIFHFPLSGTETPNIEWLRARKAAPPVNIPTEGIILGENDYRGVRTTVRMLREDRRRHVYVIGTTGSGKTTIQVNMIIQDIKNGEGCCFIDPHGDAIDDIMKNIPSERADDVILFDPADYERPQGLNLIEFDPAHPEQKTFLINELIMIFDKLYDLRSTGGPMFEQYMRNALLLIMDDPESGSTLMEISRVLADEDFRKYKLSKTKNPVVYDFWTKEAQKAGGEAALANMVPYITSKLTQFVGNDIMRPIIGQQKSAFNVREIMDSKKILLVKLSKGMIGDMNAYLLGLVIVGKLTMAALSRGDIPEKDRHDFYLYIDEFQNFITDTIATILSEARKYRLCLTIGHQYVGQLSPKGDTKVRDAVFGNVGTIVCFRVGVDDAEMMAKQLAPVFGEYDVINVEARNAYIRLLINNTAARPFNITTLPKPEGDARIAAAIKQLSRLKYGRDRSIIEAEIIERTKVARI